jgi:hypothetical protein
VRAQGHVNMQCRDTYDSCAPTTSTNPAAVNQVPVTASGSLGALNATAQLTLNGAGGFAVDLRGTFVGTVTFQGTVDGTNWTAIPVLPLGSAVQTATVTTATATGTWIGNGAGLVAVRANMTAYTSGTATVTLRGAGPVPVVNSFQNGAASTSVQLIAGGTLIGDVGVQYRTNATGAATATSVISLAATTPTQIKGTAGRVVTILLANTSAGLRSVKFFNVLSASVTMGTTSAAFEVDIPAGQQVQLEIPGGLGFATAITYAVTSAKGLTDNTSTGLAAGDVSGVIGFS